MKMTWHVAAPVQKDWNALESSQEEKQKHPPAISQKTGDWWMDIAVVACFSYDAFVLITQSSLSLLSPLPISKNNKPTLLQGCSTHTMAVISKAAFLISSFLLIHKWTPWNSFRSAILPRLEEVVCPRYVNMCPSFSAGVACGGKQKWRGFFENDVIRSLLIFLGFQGLYSR